MYKEVLSIYTYLVFKAIIFICILTSLTLYFQEKGKNTGLG